MEIRMTVLTETLVAQVRRQLWLALFVSSLAWAQGAHEITTLQIQSSTVGSGLELDGVIEPVRQSTVSSQASGRIVALLVKAGDKVRAGQLLATIDDREAQTGLQRSQAQLNQTDAELRNAQVHLQRTRDLQSRGFVSQAALDMAQTQFQGAQAGREQADALKRQSSLEQAHTRVIAPFDGWVLQTQAQAGDLALPGKPMLTIYAPQPLRAVVQLPMSRSHASRSAQVQVQVPSVQGQMQWVAPATQMVLPSADPVAQTVEWRLDLSAQATRFLVPGEQVRVRLTAAQTETRLLLPKAAVLYRGELTAVYVAKGSDFVLRAVRLGEQQGADQVEVLAGLVAGEHIALDPIRAGLSSTQRLTASAKQ
jgi:RND family efflux transporter MFP subunit